MDNSEQTPADIRMALRDLSPAEERLHRRLTEMVEDELEIERRARLKGGIQLIRGEDVTGP